MSTECDYPMGAEAKDMIEDEWAISQVSLPRSCRAVPCRDTLRPPQLQYSGTAGQNGQLFFSRSLASRLCLGVGPPLMWMTWFGMTWHPETA